MSRKEQPIDETNVVAFVFVWFLDGDMEWEEEMDYPSYSQPADDATDFDYLLQEAQQKLRRKWSVTNDNARKLTAKDLANLPVILRNR